MNRIIMERIASTGGRLGQYELLSEKIFQSLVGRCLEIKRGSRGRARELAIHDEEPQEVRRWLRALPIKEEAGVFILWPALLGGIATRFRVFVEVYDELWFPGADDVWVHPPSNDWLLELDHEEIFYFSPETNR